MDGWTALEWLALAERELLIFAGLFFLIGALDEFAIDLVWFWMRLTGQTPKLYLNREDVRTRRLSGSAAIFIPAWREQKVIQHTIAHALRAWPHQEYVIYVGVYRNDMATLEAAMRGAGADRRVRLVVHDCDGPSTKADCLNRLYRALQVDEGRSSQKVRMVVMHDAEDMVDPAELGLLDKVIDRAELIQLPVVPMAQPGSRWIGSHYCEEFAEAHGKTLVVRDWLGTCMPAAGVGCALDRGIMDDLTRLHGGEGPFAVESLTEDYELGMSIEAAGGTSRFLRVRGDDGTLVATRAYFPSRLDEAVRQKARWVHGIALQGWDRLGWEGGLAERWMRLRDRRGPMAALVLACGYGLFMLTGLLFLLSQFGLERERHHDPLLSGLIIINLASFLWRAVMRFCFTASEYGAAEGFRSILRIPVTNVIAIMAGCRALVAYVRSLGGAEVQWEKTEHDMHPAAPRIKQAELPV